MADELPNLFSDEEFNEQRLIYERRELAHRRTKEGRELARSMEERRVSPTPGRRRTDGLAESTIEQKFPHIAKKLTALWPSEACALYLSSLFISDRPNRQGFPTDVMEDLLMLNEINEMLAKRTGPSQPTAAAPAFGGAVRREHD